MIGRSAYRRDNQDAVQAPDRAPKKKAPTPNPSRQEPFLGWSRRSEARAQRITSGRGTLTLVAQRNLGGSWTGVLGLVYMGRTGLEAPRPFPLEQLSPVPSTAKVNQVNQVNPG